MGDKKKLATESNAETLRLHALMKKRNAEELRVVEEMSKHPLSLEQAREQAQRLAKRAGLWKATTAIESKTKEDSSNETI